jgi:hemerythrin-like metal-binding protein
MPIVWSPDLITGIGEIDHDHQELLWRVNIFAEAMHASRGAAALEQLFQFLNDHMRRHFETEEQLMRSSDYPGLLAHQAEHRRFLQSMSQDYAEYGRTGASASLTMRLGERLGHNLRDHMARTDKGLCDFIAAKRGLDRE